MSRATPRGALPRRSAVLAKFRFSRRLENDNAPTDDCPLSHGPLVGHSKPELVIDCDPLER